MKCETSELRELGGTGGGRWDFVIPCLPPSVNSLHNIIYSQRKVVLKPEILKWRSDIALFIPRIQLLESSLVAVELRFYYPFNYANGRLRRFDTHNMVKVLLDVLSWKAGFDDSRVKEGSWASVNSKDEKVEVRLSECAPTASARELGLSPAQGTMLESPVTTDN